MVIVGVLLGLVCAMFMSLAYLVARQDTNGASGRFGFLVRSQMVEGVIAAIALFLLWPSDLPISFSLVLPAGLSALCYVLGLLCFLTALRHTQASRVAPLLSLQVVAVAFISVIWLGNTITPLQWFGVFLAVIAAFMLSYTGQKPPFVAIISVLISCVFFALSDVFVVKTIDEFRLLNLSPFYASVISAALIYTCCGVIVLGALGRTGSKKIADWHWPATYAILWLVAGVCLFICFILVGITLREILQSTRGIFSIVIGAILAFFGFEHLEERVTKNIFWRRLGAAALMSGAIAVYLLG